MKKTTIEMIPVLGGNMEYYTRYTRYKTIAEMQEWDTENANDKELMHSYNSWVDQISKNKAPLSAEGHSNYAGCSGASIWNGKDTPEIYSIRNKILAQLINNSCITSSIYNSIDCDRKIWDRFYLVSELNKLIEINSFAMAKYQITQKVWEQIMGTSPSCIKGKNLPVESITWSEAAKFCNSLSELEGLTSAYISVNDELCLDQVTDGYRLPSIVQFGYAIEGGRKSCGEWSNGDYGWTDYNSGKWKIFGLIRDQDNPRIHPVGQKKPNKLGIYDLYGNVSEWCNDWAWFDEYINQVNKQQSPLKNPIGPDTGRFKVACGENAIGEDMAVDFEDFYEYEGMYSEELCPSNMYSGHIGFRVIKPL